MKFLKTVARICTFSENNVVGFEKQLSWVKMKNKLIKFISIRVDIARFFIERKVWGTRNHDFLNEMTEQYMTL